ncbi:MAG: glycosyltransferase family 4 protein [Clostridia bacterium]|nr:glycosyltransferase family 4 protein [Clostridia bacterium]
MNVLFLSISSLPPLTEHGISLDLIRQMRQHGHNVYAVCSRQRREGKPTSLTEECGCHVLRVRIGNNKNANVIEKGITNLMMPHQYIAAVKKYFSDVKFDVVLYPTPPVTQAATVAYIKKRDGAKSYLLLKDIFPQNAVDIGMMTKKGLKSVIYKMFRRKEEKLYRLSDSIGCMSQANLDYLLRHNPYIPAEKVHINPNSVDVFPYERNRTAKAEIYEKYGIPTEATTFIYGGNLGRPQDIPFIIECLKANTDKPDRFFVVCGNGTEYPKLKAYVEEYHPSNVLLINGLPKTEYEVFVKAFDVGLIFLDHRFTIPNFPSRLLSYMQSRMPVLACTDSNTDIGDVITDGGFGWWCGSNSVENFTAAVEQAIASDREAMGDKGYAYLADHYTSAHSYETLMNHL